MCQWKPFLFGWHLLSAYTFKKCFKQLQSVLRFRFWSLRNERLWVGSALVLAFLKPSIASSQMKTNIHNQRKKNRLVLTARLTDAEKYLSGLSTVLLLKTQWACLVRKTQTLIPSLFSLRMRSFSEFVVVVFLCERLRAYLRMLTEFPMCMFRF